MLSGQRASIRSSFLYRRGVTTARLFQALFVVAALPSDTSAQSTASLLQGTVVSSVDSTAVSGAMVRLLDEDGTVLRTVLTDSVGGFTLDRLGAGPYRLRAEGIGWRPGGEWRGRPGQAGCCQLVLVPNPVSIRGVSAGSGDAVCDIEADAGGLIRIWEAARRSVEVAFLESRRTERPYELSVRERVLDRDLDVESESEQTMPPTEGAGFNFVPLATLQEYGWSAPTADSTGDIWYYAPAPEALLSDWFEATHCFGLGEARENSVELTFESVPGRYQAGIRGAFLLALPLGELQAIHFRYQVPHWPDDEHQGGEVWFDRGEDGAWYVSRWWMRIPRLERRGRRGRIRVAGYLEWSGEARLR